MILAFAALLGFISVAFGAYSEHGLKPVITEEQYRFLLTAIRYNQVNAVVIAAIGLALVVGPEMGNKSVLKGSGILFIVGTFLFSFSIYLSVVLDNPSLVYVTPIGGVTMMLAWLNLLVFACIRIRAKKSL